MQLTYFLLQTNIDFIGFVCSRDGSHLQWDNLHGFFDVDNLLEPFDGLLDELPRFLDGGLDVEEVLRGVLVLRKNRRQDDCVAVVAQLVYCRLVLAQIFGDDVHHLPVVLAKAQLA